MQRTDFREIWNLIKDEHTAVLVTIGKDGGLDSRPMGCVQKEFDGTLWLLTFKDTLKILEIYENQQTLISYVRPANCEFISIGGRVRIVDDPSQVRSLWSEGFRVWFPDGPDSPNIALLAVDVEVARMLDQASIAINICLLLFAGADHRKISFTIANCQATNSPRLSSTAAE
jgi:general stress protein 26